MTYHFKEHATGRTAARPSWGIRGADWPACGPEDDTQQRQHAAPGDIWTARASSSTVWRLCRCLQRIAWANSRRFSRRSSNAALIAFRSAWRGARSYVHDARCWLPHGPATEQIVADLEEASRAGCRPQRALERLIASRRAGPDLIPQGRCASISIAEPSHRRGVLESGARTFATRVENRGCSAANEGVNSWKSK